MIGYILRRRYKIIEQLRTGGFGETYLAEYPQDLPVTPKYKCVIKRLIKPSTPDLDTEERFKKEAAILFTLGKEHSQIPELYDFFEENREFYLVQEFIDGHDLSYEIISGKPWSEADVIQLLQEILEVLAFVHENNVIHRDIKPLNLMRRYSDNKLVLIDFGIVKEISTLGVNAQGEISSTIPIGTRGYMPSEQFHGHPKLCSDIYALGMTAIQALTGLSPQELRIDHDTLEVVWQEQAQASNVLIEILTKMVRYDFRQRYADANEALQAFQVALLTSQATYLKIPVLSQQLQASNLSRLALPLPNVTLKPLKINEKYGYIDHQGKLVIQAQFDMAYKFSEGLAGVMVNSKFGYIDQKGKMVIPLQFDDIGAFSEELAAVMVFYEQLRFGVVEKNYPKWGYINKTGAWIIQPSFEMAYSFKNGQAKIRIGNEERYIDNMGRLINSSIQL